MRYINFYVIIITIFFVSCNYKADKTDIGEETKDNNKKFEKIFKEEMGLNSEVLTIEEYFKRFGVNNTNQIVNKLLSFDLKDDQMEYAVKSMIVILSDLKYITIEHEIEPDSFIIYDEEKTRYREKFHFSDYQIDSIKTFSIEIFKRSKFNYSVK